MRPERYVFAAVLALGLAVAARSTVSAQAPVRVGGNIPPPQKIKHVPPVYPDEALRSGVQGVVILEALIDPTGKVSEARVMRSIPMLDQAAIDAVRQWEFTPTLLNGGPVAVIMTVTVNFTIAGSNAPPPIQNVATPSSSMIRLSSVRSQDGTTTVWEITLERAMALPPWRIGSPEPPVSIGDVARIAEAWLKVRSPEVQQFALQNVTFARIGRSNPAIDFWHYQVLFLGAGARPGDLLFRVVVLPDQTVVEPRTEPDR
jgi:TonB family protein